MEVPDTSSKTAKAQEHVELEVVTNLTTHLSMSGTLIIHTPEVMIPLDKVKELETPNHNRRSRISISKTTTMTTMMDLAEGPGQCL